jgi:GLPGLI family protein
MKVKILTAALFCLCSFSTMQSQTIQVIYETQAKLQINTGDLDKSLVDQIMKKLKTKSMLCYQNGESIFKPVKNENENSSGGINIQINSPEDVTYKNHNTNRETAYKDFLGKGFLIESELKKDNWEITDSTKDIHGYTCIKAISKDEGKEKIAWFCPNLQIKDGPAYTGLDGLVLEMISEKITVVATEILSDADCQIAVPTKGKKISRDEFNEMVEKRMKAMQQGNESAGDIVIKVIK